MKLNLQHLGALITSRRKILKIKQEDLSEITGVALRTIRDLEKGKANPSIRTLSSIMDTLGLEMIFQLKK
jgi:transcriptional regulator with XRE-family HTH domain